MLTENIASMLETTRVLIVTDSTCLLKGVKSLLLNAIRLTDKVVNSKHFAALKI